jgi:hypothetical protein
MRRGRVAQVGVAVAVLTLTMGCGKHYLDQYRFSDRTMAIVFLEPPSPELRHGWYNIDVGGNAIQTVVQAGAKVAKEREASRAMRRFDSAAVNVDMPALLAARTLERAARYLGTKMVGTVDSADYVLELTMTDFGIDARSNSATYLFAKAEAVLIDRRSGREIWREDVSGRDRLTPYVIGTKSVPSAIFTAATLNQVSVAEFQAALEQLMTVTSGWITDELREDLRDVRDK